MDIISIFLIVFWSSIFVGMVVTVFMILFLKKIKAYGGADRKETSYGTEATEFNKIREKNEEAVQKKPAVRIGGLTLFPTILIVGFSTALYLESSILLISILIISSTLLLMLYDDLTDTGLIKGKVLKIRERLFFFALICFSSGFFFAKILPSTITFLPFAFFENVSVSFVVIGVLFTLWCLFWQISSVIDGVDGLSGSIFIVIFTGTLVLSVLQWNIEAIILSLLSIGVLIPWLFANHAPAKAYLTETGITTFLMLFSIITFILALGTNSGAGIWIGIIFGLLLIMTWVSTAVQLIYRKKTGKKLFRIAPIHHHFEAIGVQSSTVVLRYMLATGVLVSIGLSLFIIL